MTGGYNYGRLDSTELLLPSATSWSYSAALPSARGGLRGITLDNKVVITGTCLDCLYFDKLYVTFHVVTNNWKMQGARTPSKATMAGSPTLTLWSFLPTQRSGKISGRCQTRGGTMPFQSSILTPLRSTVQKLQHLLLTLPPNLRLLLILKVTM